MSAEIVAWQRRIRFDTTWCRWHPAHDEDVARFRLGTLPPGMEVRGLVPAIADADWKPDRRTLETLASGLRKMSPTLADEVIKIWGEFNERSDKALDDFLAYLRRP